MNAQCSGLWVSSHSPRHWAFIVIISVRHVQVGYMFIGVKEMIGLALKKEMAYTATSWLARDWRKYRDWRRMGCSKRLTSPRQGRILVSSDCNWWTKPDRPITEVSTTAVCYCGATVMTIKLPSWQGNKVLNGKHSISFCSLLSR